MFENLRKSFEDHFGEEPTVCVRAPGRVNLIGEHTDYNGGPVLPMAINREVRIAARRRSDGQLRFASVQFESQFEGSLPIRRSKTMRWANYVLGVMVEFERQGIRIGGLDLLVDSAVPTGSGLSSSAAIEVATAGALTGLHQVEMERLDLALLCQRAENEFVGVNCGLMDQVASACSKKASVLLLDCSIPRYEQIPFPEDRLAVVIAHSGVSRGLSGSAYNERRTQCEQSVRQINRLSGKEYARLSDVPIEVFEQVAEKLPDLLRRRSRHVIGETARVYTAVERLRSAELEPLGRLLDESHFSLRDDYEVSCPQLDRLTDLCRNFEGVFGSRLTGAGFGGCTVSLVRPDRAEALIRYLENTYYQSQNLEPLVFAGTPAEGLEVLAFG